jgi:hypothetical protein
VGNFKVEEFICRDGCGKVFIHPDLIPNLERIREIYNQPMIITSGYRCPVHNALIGGGPEHVRGEAADVYCAGDADRFKFLSACFAVGIKRIGIDRSFVHVGISKALPSPVVWLYGAAG